MGDPYGLPDEDLRRLISSRATNTLLPPDPLSLHPLNAPHFPPPPPPPDTTSYNDPTNTNPVVGEVFFPPRAPPFPYYHHYHNSPTAIGASTTAPSTCNSVVAATAGSSDHAFNMDIAERGWLGFDTGTNRWPRQETLSLLEIRSRLDSKFRENSQKAPLWNEISRIMAEEFGYQRSGKKCKEKFENLYKYYKKTKEGKSSRQDGKHYRFFRQLEAICGGSGEPTTTTTTHHHHHHDAAGNAGTSTVVQTPTFKNINQEINVNGGDHHDVSLSTFSNSSDQLETSSSENNNNNISYDEDLSAIAYMMKNNNNDNNNNKNKNKEEKNEQGPSSRRVRRSSSWRAKVEEIVGSHMRKIIETQDAWMERMLSAVEQREQEMASREEERKKKESMRFDQQVHELWAKERAWVESRDAALMEVVRKHIGNNNKEEEIHHRETLPINEEQQQRRRSGGRWSEMEISNLIQLRSGFEQRLRENVGYFMENNNGNVNWGEIAGKMGCLGYERSEGECKEIWDEISISLGRTVECGAKSTTTRPPWCLGLKLTDDDDV